MSQVQALLFHSGISPYLNLGLLEPLAVCQAAEAAYREGKVPVNSVEGFIRQVAGWREYIYWQYHRQMPGLDRSNFWQAERPLPSWFWDGENPMNCLRRVIRRVLEDGYCHYIERLMVISNFCQLAGIQQGYRPTQRLEPPGIPFSHLAVPNRMEKPAGEPLLAADSNWQEIGDAQADCA
jgi:deoxyribodipyrimidine photolyase-related protein